MITSFKAFLFIEWAINAILLALSIYFTADVKIAGILLIAIYFNFQNHENEI